MRGLLVSSKLINVSREYADCSFEYQCGNSPAIVSSSDPAAPAVCVPLISSSPSAGHLVINVVHRINSEDKIIASRTIKVTSSDQTQEEKFNLDKSSGDALNGTLMVEYKVEECSVLNAMSTLTRGQGLCISANFVGTPSEDLSIRVLDEKGVCVAMTSIIPPRASSFLVLHSELGDLELSVAGKNSGVFQVPFAVNIPMVVKLEAYPSGYILLHVQLLSPGTGRCVTLDTVNLDLPNGDGIIYHLESLLLDTDELAPVNTTAVCAGIVYGPILSRRELPPHPSTVRNKFTYALSNVESSSDGAEEESKKPRVCDSGIRGLVLSPDSADSKVCLRLSVLRVLDSQRSSEETVLEGPCGVLLASCVLREIDRQGVSCTGTTSKNVQELSDDVEQVKEATSGEDCFTCIMGGEIDYVGDNTDTPLAIGDRLSASVVVGYILSNTLLPEQPKDDSQPLPSESLLEDISPKCVIEPARPVLISSAPTSPQHEDTPQTSMSQSLPPGDSSLSAAGGSFVQLLSSELREKQRVIDRLLDDSTAKGEIISKNVKDIASLQKEIGLLKSKLAEAQAALSYREQESDAAVKLAEEGLNNPQSLIHCSREMLVNAVVETTHRYRKVDNERLELKRTISDSVSIRRQFVDLKKAYKELQDAHVQQARHIQQLQNQHSKVTTYQSTIMMQEKVINKMQSIIESHLRSAAKNGQGPSAMKQGLLLEPNPANRKRSAAPGEPTVRSGDGDADVQELRQKCASLEAQIQSRDIRIESLQEQLTSSAQEASREIASLRTRLFELEMTAGSSVGDPDDVDTGSLFGSPSKNKLNIPFQRPRDVADTLIQGGIASNPHSKVPSPSSDTYADLAGNVFRHRGETKSRESISQGKNLTGRREEGKRPYIHKAYRADSMTGSPRPASPSELSSFGNSDPSPRVASQYRKVSEIKDNSPVVSSRRSMSAGRQNNEIETRDKPPLQPAVLTGRSESKPTLPHSGTLSRGGSHRIGAAGDDSLESMLEDINKSSRRGSPHEIRHSPVANISRAVQDTLDDALKRNGGDDDTLRSARAGK